MVSTERGAAISIAVHISGYVAHAQFFPALARDKLAPNVERARVTEDQQSPGHTPISPARLCESLTFGTSHAPNGCAGAKQCCCVPCGMTKNIICYKEVLDDLADLLYFYYVHLRVSNSDANWFCCYLRVLHFGSVPPDV